MNIACYIRNTTVLEQVRAALTQAGFECAHFSSDTSMLRKLRQQSFDLILVDFAVAPRDDDTILSWMSCRPAESTPVLGLSPVRNAHTTALVLNCGAEDFLTRPFETVELIARVNVLLRRSNRRQARQTIELAGYSLDRRTGKFAYQGRQIELTPREFSMAWLFFSSPGVYVSRETLGSSIWSADSEVAGRTIEQHVYKLRKKLQFGPERGVTLRTAYSQGYRLELAGQDASAESPDIAAAVASTAIGHCDTEVDAAAANANAAARKEPSAHAAQSAQ